MFNNQIVELILAARADEIANVAAVVVDAAVAEVDAPGIGGIVGVNGRRPVIQTLRIREKCRVYRRRITSKIGNAHKFFYIWQFPI